MARSEERRPTTTLAAEEGRPPVLGAAHRWAGALRGGALEVPEFRRFWVSSIVSNVGSWMQIVAQGWLIVQLTNSPFYLGLVGLMRAIPALTVTLIGGVLADRIERRTMLLFTQTSAGLLALLLGLLDAAGVVTIWHILVISFLSSTVMALDNPARQALVPDLVGKDRIPSAVGLNSAAWNGAAVIGPSVAGVLVAWVSTAGAFILNGLSYFAVVWAVWTLPRQPRLGGQQPMLKNLLAGLDFIRRDRRVWGLMLVAAVPALLGRPYQQLMPIFARDVLHGDASAYGVLMAASGLGALVGAILVSGLGNYQRKGLLLLVVTAIFGASLLAFAASRWFVPSLAVLLVVGATATLQMGLTNTLLQMNVPGEMRGRVMSAYTLIPMGFMPLGSMLLGSVAEAVGVTLTVAAAALAVALFALAALRALPELRRMT